MDDPTRRVCLSAASALAIAWLARPAAAQIPVFDLSRFTSMVDMIRKAIDVYNQVRDGARALENAARQLDPRSVGSVEDILLGIRRLTADGNAIGYRIDTVSRQFNALFPDEAAARDITPQEAAELTERWDQELHMSSLTAARSQTTLSSIETNTRAARDVLSASSGETSAVAQLQALVQMIHLINSDLANLATTLGATERVNSTLAGTEASSREIAADRRRRLLEAYDARPVDTGVDERFLGAP